MLKDKDIREPLFDFLEDRHSKIRIIEEKSLKKRNFRQPRNKGHSK